MVDDLAIIRAYLAADASITTLTGTRIWARRRAPKERWKPSDGACLVFARRGGGGTKDQHNHALSVSYQFKCYGGGGDIPAQELSAAGLYRTVFDVMADAGSYEILGSQTEGTAVDLEEPDTGWPYTLAFFRVQLRNV